MYTEEELISYLVQKKPEVISYFIYKYQNYLYSICFSVLRNKEEAEEATQDSFLKILRAIDTYSLKGKITTWMYTVAYRTALDYIKRRKRSEPLEERDYSTTEDGSSALMSQEKIENVSQLVNQLPSADAGLIRLYYLEDMSVKELSQTLEQSESNIKIKLFRARKLLYKLAKRSEYFKEYSINM